MPVTTKSIKLSTRGDNDIIDITPDVRKNLLETNLQNGVVTVFCPGSTGGITTVEYEPGLVRDVKDFFEEIAPQGKIYQHNLSHGDGNGHAHVRATLLGPSLSVPFVNGELTLGVWQQIIFIDFDTRPRRRELVMQVVGE